MTVRGKGHRNDVLEQVGKVKESREHVEDLVFTMSHYTVYQWYLQDSDNINGSPTSSKKVNS